MINPLFNAVLDRMREVHDKKNHDYADDDNPFSNFEGAARMSGLSAEQVLHVMMSIKLERLRQLVSGKEPNFEGVEDTLLDLANYAAIWLAYRLKDRNAYKGKVQIGAMPEERNDL
jgi:hypothetical protein